jgi:integrase
LKTDLTAYVFDPREVVAEHLAARRSARKKEPTPHGLRERAKRRQPAPKHPPGPCYTTQTYRDAIRRACMKAGVPHWHPNQLRHNAATRIRREYVLDASRVILGHSSPIITEIYAELDHEKAREVVSRIG